MLTANVPMVERRALLGGALGLLALAGVPLVAGCSASGPTPVTPTTEGLHTLTVDAARQQVTVGSVPDLAEVVAGMRLFGDNLHQVTATSSANWTASPLSIAVAFGMLRAGARGATAKQLDHVFGFPTGSTPQGSPHAALNALAAAIVTTSPATINPSPSSSSPPPPIVDIANGFFLDNDFATSVRPAFLQLLATQYGAHATGLSFADQTAAATINAWVAEQTRNRIKMLFRSLPANTKLALVNAVYLKTTWLNQFDPANTAPGQFTAASGSPVIAQLMHNSFEQVRFTENPSWQRITLPYVGGELAMRIVLPVGVVKDIPTLTKLVGIAAGSTSTDPSSPVHLTLPKWDAATTLKLLPALSALGFRDVTDLSGIAPGLDVSAAIHKADITVDEMGTEAAAVTGITVAQSAIAATPVPMVVNRPFAWAVVHEPTDTPIFTGHVIDPTVA
jgi:serine protease inhibitor